ncbi:hypothetical protein JCM3765_007455 [Sporobolomyces pararoseus]
MLTIPSYGLSDRSQGDTSVLSHETVPNYLPPLDLLASFLPSQPAKIVSMCSHSVPFYVYSARLLAQRAVDSVPNDDQQRDFEILEHVWNRLDNYNSWSIGALNLISASRSAEITPTTESILKSAITLIWMPFLLLEFSVLSYLDLQIKPHQQIVTVSLNGSGNVSSVTSLHSIAVSRSARALCLFLRYTRNCEGMYLLVASAGHQFSVSRLTQLAYALMFADVEDWDLFPLGLSDKLASVTFFIQTLESARAVYACTELSKSIELLGLLQKDLERRTGYSGESALTLLTSFSLEVLCGGPQSLPPMSTQVAVSIYRGSSP